MSILKRGLKGAPVKRLQEKLGIAADGDFGPGTEKAVKDFQAKAGLAADGIAGPDTFAALGLHELVLLRVGTRGAEVKKLQEALGIGADGIFGKGTAAAVKAFQEENGLAADGMAGPRTLAKMSAFAEITEEVIERAEPTPEEEESFEAEPLPEIKGGEVVAAAPAEEAPKEEEKPGLWGRMTGWLS